MGHPYGAAIFPAHAKLLEDSALDTGRLADNPEARACVVVWGGHTGSREQAKGREMGLHAAGGVVELTREEGRKMLGERTRRELGMTLEEFEAAYDAGTLDMDNDEVIGLAMLLPFARRVPVAG
ncbi:MAG: hypothetical protein ACRDOE_10145 [Streptosporangiaceae bacterium]